MEKNKKELNLENIAELIEASATKTRKDLTGLINETRNTLEKKIDSVEESLGASMQRQFLAERDYVDKRFDDIDKRFDETDEKLEDIKANINKKTGKIEHNDLTYRVEKLEKKMKLVTV